MTETESRVKIGLQMTSSTRRANILSLLKLCQHFSCIFSSTTFAEEEVFKIKRSSHSRKVAKQLKRESKKEKEEREKREEEKTGIPMGGGTKQKDVVEKQTGEVSNGGSADDVEVGSDAGASSLSNLGEDDEEGDREEEEKGHKFSKSFKNMLQSTYYTINANYFTFLSIITFLSIYSILILGRCYTIIEIFFPRM